MKVVVVALLYVVCSVWGHGVMTTPKTRNDYLSMSDPNFSNYDAFPIMDPASNKFVCNDHDGASSTRDTYVAGNTYTVEWQNFHPGDVFLYLTYDGDKASYSEMKWFKIWAYTQKQFRDPAQQWTMPSYLPSSSHAILRWEMYALHLRFAGTIEFYTVCKDIVIQGKADGQLPTPQVTIPGHLPKDASQYREAENYSGTGFYFMGPVVASIGGTQPTAPVTQAPTPPSPMNPSSPPSSPSSPSNTGGAQCQCTTNGAVAVCLGYSCPVGTEYCPCSVNGECNSGYSCITKPNGDICVATQYVKGAAASVQVSIILIVVAIIATLF